jgi:hypothetical protein
MATFPAYAKVAKDGYSEAHAPIAVRSEMDRGIPKQRKTQSDIMITIKLNLLFLNKTDAANFEDWFYSPAGAAAGAAFFDWTDPRTGVVRQARAVANALGPLGQYGGTSAFIMLTRTLDIEYLRSLT